MKVNDLTPIIVALYNANRTGMFWGAPGIGKSSAFKLAAEVIKAALGLTGPVLLRHEIAAFRRAGGNMKQAFGLFDLRLSQMDPVEVGGLPRENKETGSMDKLPPSWFAHEGRPDLPDHGILLLEELPSAPLSVQTTAYQITLDGIIEDFKLKSGWGTFAAGNRVTDGGQYYKMPDALADRMCHIDVESNLDSFVEWAIAHSIDHSIVAYVRFAPDQLNNHAEKVAKKSKEFAFTTERSWEAVHDTMVNNPSMDDITALAIFGGFLGKGPAAGFTGFRKVWTSIPDVNEILIDPQSARMPEDAASQYAVMTMLGVRANYDNLQNCLVYADRFIDAGRPEMAVLFMKDMQRRQGLAAAKAKAVGEPFASAVQSPAYSKWAAANAQLF